MKKKENITNEINKKVKTINKKTLTIIIISVLSVLIIASAIVIPLMLRDNDTSDADSSDTSSSYSDNAESEDDSSADSKADVSEEGSSDKEASNKQQKSNRPAVTLAAQVSDNICIVGGMCSTDTEYVSVWGTGVEETKIVPYAGGSVNYFIGQVKYNQSTTINVSAKAKGKEASDPATRSVSYEFLGQNYMFSGEYSPVIGKNSRMHFYSALLNYSIPSSSVSASMQSMARNNISQIVSAANSVGAETIFLIIPSSAEIYPETVPGEFTKSSQNLFSVFNNIATSCGAKVIYPINTMKKHTNDGAGYQIYQHTDSHWSTYGAYWGTYDLFNYISQRFPAAKPRTVSEMKFYLTEMYGGDALFNLPGRLGFETSWRTGVASKTNIKELTTLYSLKTPTNTLGKIYNDNVGLYLSEYNSSAAIEINPYGEGLPTAVIMRDSFGKVAYDMINDRFKTVYWEEFNNYNLPYNDIVNGKPDYVIYLYSERNLLKLMLNNSGASILNLK